MIRVLEQWDIVSDYAHEDHVRCVLFTSYPSSPGSCTPNGRLRGYGDKTRKIQGEDATHVKTEAR